MVGEWKGDKFGWEIVFDADGTVSSAVIALGQVRIKPNQITEVQGRKGEPGIFEAGDCDVNYNPKNHEISINIEIKRAYMEIGGGVLKGPCQYFIIGSVLEDEVAWDAEVFTAFDLVVLLPDPNSTNGKPVHKGTGNFQQDFDMTPDRVIFTKVKGSGDKR